MSGRALLLGDRGDHGDVRLLDCRSANPTPSVGEQVAAAMGDRPVGVRLSDPALAGAAVAAGAALIHLDAAGISAPEVRLGAEAGVVVMLTSPDPDHRWQAALDLLAHGGGAGRVVLEVPVTFDNCGVDAALLERAGGSGLAVGAVLAPGAASADEVAGWEIGMLTRLLPLGVGTIRNVSSKRFRRVQAVVDALAEVHARLAAATAVPAGTPPRGARLR